MPKAPPRGVFALVLATLVGVAHVGSASASIPDPPSNFAANPACSGATACVQAAIGVLDQARARLGQPPYALPSNFLQLTPDEQAFVLVDLDRVLYGLAPITGLTDELDQAAAGGVRAGADPMSTDPTLTTLTSDWAGGYRNLPLAYEAWMYDDGPGSPNLDCTALASSGCWGHRHNVLTSFDGGGALAMGAAAGTDSQGQTSYALLLVQGDSGFHPDYRYTWSQALAAGAAGGPATSPPLQALPVPRVRLEIMRLTVRGRELAFRIAAPPGLATMCSLTRARGVVAARYARCGRRVIYRRLSAGAYRLRVRAGQLRIVRAVRIG